MAFQPAESSNDLLRRRVKQRDAVPENIAVRRAQQKRPLADREIGLRADLEQASLVLPPDVGMI